MNSFTKVYRHKEIHNKQPKRFHFVHNTKARVLIIFIFFLHCNLKTDPIEQKFANEEIRFFDNDFPGIEPPGDKYAPPNIVIANTSGVPQIGEWTKTAGSNQSIVLTGYNLTDAAFYVFSKDGLKQASTQYLDNEKAIVTISKNQGSWSQFLIWPKNKHGYGKAVAVNKTEVWWVGPDKINAGSKTSVFGRNLANKNGTAISYAYLQSKRDRSIKRLAVSQVNPYKIDFLIPAGLQSGDYYIWVHNGHGGKYGWSKPLPIKIGNQAVWSSNKSSFFYARDTINNELQGLIDKASTYAFQNNTYATVLLPAGTFIVRGSIRHKSRVRLLGAGINKTIIKCSSDFVGSEGIITANSSNNMSLQNLTIDAANRIGFPNGILSYRDGNDNIWFDSVEIISKGEKSIDFHNSSHIHIRRSTITGGALGKENFFGTAYQVFINEVTFKMSNAALMAVKFQGGHSISITNSTCSDLGTDKADRGMGRFIVFDGIWGHSSHIYIAGNSTYALEPIAEIDDNMGEQILWESHFAKWKGYVKNATSNTIRVAGLTLTGNAYAATIVKGKGLGQTRRIGQINNNVMTFENPWNVIPDSTSILHIGTWNERSVVYKNSLTGTKRVTTQSSHSASAGIQTFGGVQDFIADGNIITSTRFGIRNFVTVEGQQNGRPDVPKNILDPHYFHLYANNVVKNCRWGIVQTDIYPADSSIGILGAVYRNNKISGSVVADVQNEVNNDAPKRINSNLFESNSLKPPSSKGVFNQVLLNND